jgi:hypothetical protein
MLKLSRENEKAQPLNGFLLAEKIYLFTFIQKAKKR